MWPAFGPASRSSLNSRPQVIDFQGVPCDMQICLRQSESAVLRTASRRRHRPTRNPASTFFSSSTSGGTDVAVAKVQPSDASQSCRVRNFPGPRFWPPSCASAFTPGLKLRTIVRRLRTIVRRPLFVTMQFAEGLQFLAPWAGEGVTDGIPASHAFSSSARRPNLSTRCRMDTTSTFGPRS